MIPSGVNSCQMPIKFMKEAMVTISFMEHMARRLAFRRLQVRVGRTTSALSSMRALTKLILLTSQFGVIGTTELEQSMMTRFNTETWDLRRSSGAMMTKYTLQMELWKQGSPKKYLPEMEMTTLILETTGRQQLATGVAEMTHLTYRFKVNNWKFSPAKGMMRWQLIE